MMERHYFNYKNLQEDFQKVKVQLRAKGISNQAVIVNYLLALPTNTVKWYTMQYQSATQFKIRASYIW